MTGNRVHNVVLGYYDTDLIKIIDGKVYIYIIQGDCFAPVKNSHKELYNSNTIKEFYNIEKVMDKKILQEANSIKIIS